MVFWINPGPVEPQSNIDFINNVSGNVGNSHQKSAKTGKRLQERAWKSPVREAPRFGPFYLAPVSANELKERALQGVV